MGGGDGGSGAADCGGVAGVANAGEAGGLGGIWLGDGAGRRNNADGDSKDCGLQPGAADSGAAAAEHALEPGEGGGTYGEGVRQSGGGVPVLAVGCGGGPDAGVGGDSGVGDAGSGSASAGDPAGGPSHGNFCHTGGDVQIKRTPRAAELEPGTGAILAVFVAEFFLENF